MLWDGVSTQEWLPVYCREVLESGALSQFCRSSDEGGRSDWVLGVSQRHAGYRLAEDEGEVQSERSHLGSRALHVKK